MADLRPEQVRAAVRERVAMGLVNTLIAAKEEQDLERRNVLLAELRQLAYGHRHEPSMQRLAHWLEEQG